MKHILLFLFISGITSVSYGQKRYQDWEETSFIIMRGIRYELVRESEEAVNGIIYDKYDNGYVKWEAEYERGRLNGFSRYYHENGNLKCEYNSIDGSIIDEKVITYDADGKELMTEFYEKGEIINCTGDCSTSTFSSNGK